MKKKLTIVGTNLPYNSLLHTIVKRHDYVDSFQGSFIDNENSIRFTDVINAFFASRPTWVGNLFALRNKIVAVFGLKTPNVPRDRQKQLSDFKFAPGERLGIFKFFSKTDTEIVVGEDDKHLNFRLSLILSQSEDDELRRNVTVSSVIKFHNGFGQLYFFLVKPFHKIIVPAMLREAIKVLEQKNKRQKSKRTRNT